MSTRATGARFRQRKLNPKHNLQVLHEDDVGDLFGDENDPTRHIPRVETGVEKTEEVEHHLQAVISASAAASLGGKVAQIYIPTPEAKSSAIKYDDLYPKSFASPTTYIRTSSTVEDCIGPPYCMDDDDDKFLRVLNNDNGPADKAKDSKASGGANKCSEDVFEEVMSFFEETALTRQPFAAVDSPPVLNFSELQAAYDETISVEARGWAERIYPHWQKRRLEKGNSLTLLPSLKGETGQESDETDAYVCFRRREVRTARKTRGRDAQVVEKLKKLRRELEEARQLVHMINQREKLYADRIDLERKVFEQRSELKRIKIDQGIKGDSDQDLLVTQKPAPKPKVPKPEPQRPATLRLSTSRPEARQPENDLVQLADVQEQHLAAVDRFVEGKIAQGRERNVGVVDYTWRPITPPALDLDRSSSAYLPSIEEVPVQEAPVQVSTPPASVKDVDMSDAPRPVPAEQTEDDAQMDVVLDVPVKEGGTDLPTPVSDQGIEQQHHKTEFRLASPPPEPTDDSVPYRRRYGRNGILHIEECRRKRTLPGPRCDVVYDSDDEDQDGDAVVYPVDPYGIAGVHFRAQLLSLRPRVDTSLGVGSRRASTAVGSGPASAAGGDASAIKEAKLQAASVPKIKTSS